MIAWSDPSGLGPTPADPAEERESMRNLLDGLFGVFRNVYDHRDVDPEWYEVEAVLSMINWALKRIDKYPSPAGDGTSI